MSTTTSTAVADLAIGDVILFRARPARITHLQRLPRADRVRVWAKPTHQPHRVTPANVGNFARTDRLDVVRD